MKNQFSNLGNINLKEAVIGLLITIAVALVDLLWTGVNPIIAHLQETQTFDLSLFTTKVNWETAWDTATMTAIAYVTVILSSGEKKIK
jgi:hypothetical protein